MQVIWSPNGHRLKAFEYFNPDDPYDESHVRHIRIINPQVVMSTPEEVINYCEFQPGRYDGAAAFDCGQSKWLQSFAQQHLKKCSHFRLMFYDELYDIIADELEFNMGRYKEEAQQGMAGNPQHLPSLIPTSRHDAGACT